MALPVLSAFPAANGVRRVPKHMPLQIPLIYKVLMTFTPQIQSTATCGVASKIGELKLHVSIGWHYEDIQTHFGSSSWFAFAKCVQYDRE